MLVFIWMHTAHKTWNSDTELRHTRHTTCSHTINVNTGFRFHYPYDIQHNTHTHTYHLVYLFFSHSASTSLSDGNSTFSTINEEKQLLVFFPLTFCWSRWRTALIQMPPWTFSLELFIGPAPTMPSHADERFRRNEFIRKYYFCKWPFELIRRLEE